MPESNNLRERRREEIRKTYEDFAAKQVPPILEYWQMVQPDKNYLYYLPVKDPLNYEINYFPGHVWDEKELLTLMFNIEELKLEPQLWETMGKMREKVFPEKRNETVQMLETIKQDWEQKYSDAVGWRVLAKTAVQYGSGVERTSVMDDKSGGRPAVIAPADIDTNQPKAQRKGKEKEKKQGLKSPTGVQTRKVGQSRGTTVPSPEEVKRDKEAALEAATAITGGNVTAPKSTGGRVMSPSGERKGLHEKGGKNSKPQPESPVGAEITNKDKTTRGVKPQMSAGVGQKTRKEGETNMPLPPKNQGKSWYCDNCAKSHPDPLCNCPICYGPGHLYY
ncbi:MAG: hypothetical protein MJE68_27015, partial [Proteobacteria bacterium]|nr:hypothetical protein [Pseudomonadota bacterium]